MGPRPVSNESRLGAASASLRPSKEDAGTGIAPEEARDTIPAKRFRGNFRSKESTELREVRLYTYSKRVPCLRCALRHPMLDTEDEDDRAYFEFEVQERWITSLPALVGLTILSLFNVWFAVEAFGLRRIPLMDAAIANLLVAFIHNGYVVACRVIFGADKFWKLSCVRVEVTFSFVKLAGAVLVLVFVLLEKKDLFSLHMVSLYWVLFVTALILPRSALILHSWLACQRLARRTVSQKRKRYCSDGFDLDLSYISERILAMSFPAQDLEARFRNPLPEVRSFLNQHHPDHRVYNLCREPDRRYDEKSFHEVSTRICFYDHTPCPLEQLLELVEDQHRYLSSDTGRVVVIHCKAGKGRTGLVCTCLLLREGLEMTASEALSTYADRRTHNHKGVTIPSQIRYVQYYEQCLRERRLRKWETVYLERVCLENIVSPGRCSRCSIQVQVLDVDRRLLSQSAWTALSESIEDEDSHSEAESSHLQEGLLVLELDGPELPADFHVILRARWEEFCGCGRAETVKLCSFWLNTGYVTEEMRLQMSELDFAKPTPPSFDDYSVICCFHCCNPMEAKTPFYEVTEEEFERLWLSGAVDGASEVEDEVYEISEEDFDRLLKAGQLQLARLEAMDNDASAVDIQARRPTKRPRPRGVLPDEVLVSSLPTPLVLRPPPLTAPSAPARRSSEPAPRRRRPRTVDGSETKKALTGFRPLPAERTPRGEVAQRTAAGSPARLLRSLRASISGSVVPLTEAEEQGEIRVARRLPANGRLPRISLPNTWEALRKSNSCSGTDAGGESDMSSPSPVLLPNRSPATQAE
ncbi:Phosphatidylinositol 3,4,5-trisphosphate 3-phosphatase TPTE2 [Symbiodinium microadriaticum]|uniref:Phosphatidylinositol 3,4,5-trisphosphate 3-phosphatase TPTE2 n=1 Tax=Symbiodinium microadriaticum TaxID=2951 RepID=A0A1Q9DK63_SYMMI|nr:Phosphatidylinositol 3,4,5-trisphosphate 3-phosphatase TPTE2 [Symbiodinium microadriaticum]